MVRSEQRLGLPFLTDIFLVFGNERRQAGIRDPSTRKIEKFKLVSLMLSEMRTDIGIRSKRRSQLTIRSYAKT